MYFNSFFQWIRAIDLGVCGVAECLYTEIKMLCTLQFQSLGCSNSIHAMVLLSKSGHGLKPDLCELAER